MTLHLWLQFKWYDMIAKGVKTEEYRAITPYWVKRLNKPYTHVCFHKGYNTNQTMTYRIESISKGVGKTEWGAPQKRVFIIRFV